MQKREPGQYRILRPMQSLQTVADKLATNNSRRQAKTVANKLKQSQTSSNSRRQAQTVADKLATNILHLIRAQTAATVQ